MYLELLARNVLSLPHFVRLLFICCLQSSFANVDVCHYVFVVLSIGLARCDRLSIRHLLHIPWFHRHILCTSHHSSCFSFFHSLGLGDSVSVCTHPFPSRQSSLDNRSDPFSTFIVVWFCRTSVRCQRCRTQTISSVTASLDVCREHRINLLGSTSGIISTAILGNGCPAPSLSDVTFFVNFNPSATICHGEPHQPPQFAAAPASFSCRFCWWYSWNLWICLSICRLPDLPLRCQHSWAMSFSASLHRRCLCEV